MSVIEKLPAGLGSTNQGATQPVLAARDVSKTFTMPEEHVHTLKERVLHPRRRIGSQSFEALKDISFEVYPGEFFGIAGRNGSGKSTLLKCIAGIYTTTGHIWRTGRMSTFIELGVGFNPDLAARDNVILNGIMMGLSPREARRRVDRVIDFAELREFKDLKLKNYSSGMHVRLAFSVAIQVDADTLLIDEVLAVGDAAFQQKCFDVFNEMRDAGKTIVFVTHDMGAMSRFCHRAMLLERGVLQFVGDPGEVSDRYLELNFGRDPAGAKGGEHSGGDGQARVLEAWSEDEHGARSAAVSHGRRLTLRARVCFHVDVQDPAVGVSVLNDEHRPVVMASTSRTLERSGTFRAGEEAVFSFGFDNVLSPGRYSPVYTLSHRGAGVDLIDRFEGGSSFVVSGRESLGGIVDIQVDVAASRISPLGGEAR